MTNVNVLKLCHKLQYSVIFKYFINVNVFKFINDGNHIVML